jgi:hypothetical protein
MARIADRIVGRSLMVMARAIAAGGDGDSAIGPRPARRIDEETGDEQQQGRGRR